MRLFDVRGINPASSYGGRSEQELTNLSYATITLRILTGTHRVLCVPTIVVRLMLAASHAMSTCSSCLGRPMSCPDLFRPRVSHHINNPSLLSPMVQAVRTAVRRTRILHRCRCHILASRKLRVHPQRPLSAACGQVSPIRRTLTQVREVLSILQSSITGTLLSDSICEWCICDGEKSMHEPHCRYCRRDIVRGGFSEYEADHVCLPGM